MREFNVVMKRVLLILLLFTCGYVQAQSLTLNDLTNLAQLSNGEAHDYLVLSRKFKRDYIQKINGKQVENYKGFADTTKRETVIIGDGQKLDNGAMLRNVYYATNNRKFLLNMIGQAKQSNFKLSFTGMDANNNIFMFDDDLYHIIINVGRGKGTGSVSVKQKEYSGVY